MQQYGFSVVQFSVLVRPWWCSSSSQLLGEDGGVRGGGAGDLVVLLTGCSGFGA